jgi:hypothetical protein
VIFADIGRFVVGPVKARAALQHHKHVIFVRMGMQPVLAARGVDLERRPHIVGLGEIGVAAALVEQLGMQAKHGRLDVVAGAELFLIGDLVDEGCGHCNISDLKPCTKTGWLSSRPCRPIYEVLGAFVIAPALDPQAV